jgi:hypothetical protein
VLVDDAYIAPIAGRLIERLNEGLSAGSEIVLDL